MTLLFFLALSILAIAGALGVVLSKNPVYSALSLLLNFAILAVMFIMLHAQFVAVVQIIVYAGAVVVLFLFVIMLIGGDLGLFAARGRGRTIAAYVAVVAGVLMLLGLGYMAIAGVTASTDRQRSGQWQRPGYRRSIIHEVSPTFRVGLRPAARSHDRRRRSSQKATLIYAQRNLTLDTCNHLVLDTS